MFFLLFEIILEFNRHFATKLTSPSPVGWRCFSSQFPKMTMRITKSANEAEKKQHEERMNKKKSSQHKISRTHKNGNINTFFWVLISGFYLSLDLIKRSRINFIHFILFNFIWLVFFSSPRSLLMWIVCPNRNVYKTHVDQMAVFVLIRIVRNLVDSVPWEWIFNDIFLFTIRPNTESNLDLWLWHDGNDQWIWCQNHLLRQILQPF